jgi:hypothetical protein
LVLIAGVQGMDGSSTKLRTAHGDSIPGISKIKDIIIYKDSIGYTWAVQLDENRALVTYYFNQKNGIRHITGTILAIGKK